MGKQEWDGFAELKQIYHSKDHSFNNALNKAGDDIYRREAILRKRTEETEALAGFCQSNALEASTESDRKAWMKEANTWLGKKQRLQRDLDEVSDDMEDPPLPDREKKNGEWVDIEYY